MTVPALSETQFISHPQISQIYDMPFSAFCAFFVLTAFFDLGFSTFDSVFTGIIFLTLSKKKQFTRFNIPRFYYLHLIYRLILMIFIHIVIKFNKDFLEFVKREL